jgi:CUG-BP- and ETR3-like factor
LNEEDIFPTFDQFGPLKDVAVIRDKHTGLHRGCAFITYWAAADAERAQEALHDKYSFPGARRPAQVKPAEPTGRCMYKPSCYSFCNRDVTPCGTHSCLLSLFHVISLVIAVPENKLFVGMLSRKAGELEVRELFEPFGEIREIYMIRNADGSSKCAAFLRYVMREAAVQAIESLHNNIVMDGAARPLIVKFADNKQQREQRQVRNMRRQELLATMPSGYPPYQIQNQMPMAGPHGPQYLNPPQYAGAYGAGSPPPPHGAYGAGTPPPPHGAYGAGTPPVYGAGTPPPPHGHPPHLQHHSIIYPPHYQFAPAPPFAAYQSRQDTRPSNPRPREGPAGANLFVYHLPHDLTDADLATAFNPFGNVISAKVYVDKFTGESKGFGKSSRAHSLSLTPYDSNHPSF